MLQWSVPTCSTATGFDSYNSLCFKIIDKVNSKFDLKIKEALHINWRKLKCTTKSFSSRPFTIASVPSCFFSIFVFFIFAFLFHPLFLLSLALIIRVIDCLNYTSLLLHPIKTHLVSHFSPSSIVFIIYMLIIGIFYCLYYTSLLLHLFITQLAIDFTITM